jgi:hypothetical protein
MNEPTLNTLTQRLDRLERDNRRLKIAGAILLLALAAVGAMGQVLPKAVPKVVEAERFVLRDTKGKILATLIEALGTPALVLFDQNGKARAGLTVLPDGRPGLSLYDQNEKKRAGLTVVGDGTPSLALSDQNEKVRAGLGVLADGAPGLFLSDQNEKVRAGLMVDTSGPSLVLRDENRNRAVLGHAALEATATGTVEQRPASSLVLFDKDGKVIWKAP